MATTLDVPFLLGGREVMVKSTDDSRLWHRSVVVCRCHRDVYQRVMEADPFTDTDAFYWIMTPDSDVYPEELSVHPLLSLMGTTPDGDLVLGSGIGRTSHLNRVYAFSPFPTPAAFAEALRACQTEAEQAILDLVQSVSLSLGQGALPPATGAWRRITTVGIAGVALVSRSGELLVLMDCVATSGAASPELDARILEISRDKLGKQHEDVKDAIDCCTESVWDSWPLTGPRTVLWCLTFIAQTNGHPRARHTWWKHTCRLTSGDPGVSDHETAMKGLEYLLTYDQLNAPELVFAELFTRRAQLAEFRHRHLLLRPDDFGDDLANDEFLYLGLGETRGQIMLCPALDEYVAANLHRESTAAKERRKLREERQLARASPSMVPSQAAAAALTSAADPLRGLVGGPPAIPKAKAKQKGKESKAAAGHAPVAKELLPTMAPFCEAAQFNSDTSGSLSRSVKRRLKVKTHWQAAVNSAVESTNDLRGVGRVESSLGLSRAQRGAHEHISRIFRAVLPPPCAAVEAFKELCGTRAGYDDADPRVAFQYDLISMPSRGGVADGDEVLTGGPLYHWNNCVKALMRSDQDLSDTSGLPVKPYPDPTLIRDNMMYAKLIADMCSLGLCSLRAHQAATVGIFFARKKNGMQGVILLDTRLVNARFQEAEHAVLPAPGAWASIELQPEDELVFSHMDVECAFYRIRAPPGVSDHFVLPRVSGRLIRQLAPACDVAGADWLSPHLEAMAMGWSWALHFCQQMVVASVQKVGIPAGQFFRGKRPSPDLTDAMVAAAVYVDNAIVTGTDEKRATVTADAVFKQLEADGLDCKTIEHGPEVARFTGLDLRRASGRISVGHARCWKVRLALSHVLAVGRASGPEMHTLLGRYTWSAILRRRLLSLPRACYRFVDKAGPERVPLWCSVRRELKWMVPLLPLAYADAKRPWRECVAATDSEGANLIDNGGFGVVGELLGSEQARAWGLQQERWRFAVADAVQARAAALAAAAAPATAGSPGPQAGGASQAPLEGSVELPVSFSHLAADSGFISRWAPGEFNPADGPSRLKGPVVRSGSGDPRDARWHDCSTDTQHTALLAAVEARARDEFRRGGAGGPAAGSWRAAPPPIELTGADDAIDDWYSAAGTRRSSSSSAPQSARGPALRSRAGVLPVKRPLGAADLTPPSAQQRRARARRRVEVHRAQASLCRDLGAYFLEVGHQAGMPLSTPLEIDLALVEHLEDLYFNGFNHDAGEKVVASLEFRTPELKVPGSTLLPRAKNALRGFRRLAPGLSRAPFPWLALCAMAGAAMSLGRQEMLSVASKTHEFDESLLLDDVEFDSSVRRYEKHARVLKQAGNMTPASREHGLLVADHLADILAGRRAAPQPPNMRVPQLDQAGGRRRGKP
ncbi:unnamed protein product [Prorocentrum cordatum]|uniref:RNA-dependent RNA polymerase n=1 Tax=Prorocentrum cordatum TaxID=2364126 RepID=A0ABN9QER9_9DINO|nr:unnamed protein product [Polarella glacialis]